MVIQEYTNSWTVERFIEYFKISHETVIYIKNDIIDTKQIETILKETDST